MDSQHDEAIRRRWEQEAKDKADAGKEPPEGTQRRPAKRPRAIEYRHRGGTVDDSDANMALRQIAAGSSKTTLKTRSAAAEKTSRSTGARARNGGEESVEGDVIVELD